MTKKAFGAAGLGDTLRRLADEAAARSSAYPYPGGADDRLTDVGDFGSNPGALDARCFVPADLPQHAPLVVVLHGCTQDAAGYERGSGWSRLAAEAGFALLFPQQRRANNPNLCFNWFQPGDIRAGAGEAASIRAMIAAMVTRHGLDPNRVFITGLSAGGAMALAMLASYPEVFAGGGIIAGLPFGVADTVAQALERMRGQGLPTPATLAARLRAAGHHPKKWPRLSVWHGDADGTVAPANAEAIIAQWAGVQGITSAPRRETGPGHIRRVWRDSAGRDAIEAVTVSGLGHGTPIAATGPEADGLPGPFMLDAGLSSTRRMAAFWGIAPAIGAAAARPPVADQGSRVLGIINRSLRQAGLIG